MEKLVNAIVVPTKQFAAESYRFVARCTKPDTKELSKIAIATSIGFGVLGFVGFAIKLVFIPINNVIVGPSA
ncbi:putative Protein transport protein Sec61 subunit gamma [Paratrimastix pyriformis]|uniref:Uncharacterized protein n=1 Tax=Paratrimastix pyriformis TaxID=342808 RepID=A0ABQ8UZS9_9EUKA|nr:putative Protein transport protein Sec61 subunit gamma [Paratrimastix pyriformis]